MQPRRRIWRALGAALLAAALSACATPQADRLLHDRGSLPAQAQVEHVPFYSQDRFYCGPASMAMVLTWSGVAVTRDRVALAVYTPGREGSLPSDMAAAPRRYGRQAIPITNLADLLAELAAGHPVIVFQNLGLSWLPQWHFAVATGYDLDRGEILLHSATIRDHRTSLTKFEHTWRRGNYWGLAVLPPGRLPARGDPLDVLRAAAAFERVHRYAEAAETYGAALRRWPDNLGAAIGLGNARYAAGDRLGAESAFLAAATLHPEAPAAWNNLAHVLAESGQRPAAIHAAQRAVQHGGATAAYRDTLEEISRN